jgi:hypothetical protein
MAVAPCVNSERSLLRVVTFLSLLQADLLTSCPNRTSCHSVAFGKSSPHPIRPLLTTNSYTIIDEADELLHVGWEADMAKIMSGGGKKNALTCLSKHR